MGNLFDELIEDLEKYKRLIPQLVGDIRWLKSYKPYVERRLPLNPGIAYTLKFNVPQTAGSPVTISVVLAEKRTLVQAVWSHDGRWSYIPEPNIRTTYEKVEKYLREGYFDCAMCRKRYRIDMVEGDHFAARFCQLCWEKYKQKNSSTCMLCKKARWQCVC